MFTAFRHQMMYSSLVGMLFFMPSTTLHSLSQQSNNVWTYGSVATMGLESLFLGSKGWNLLKPHVVIVIYLIQIAIFLTVPLIAVQVVFVINDS